MHRSTPTLEPSDAGLAYTGRPKRALTLATIASAPSRSYSERRNVRSSSTGIPAARSMDFVTALFIASTAASSVGPA